MINVDHSAVAYTEASYKAINRIFGFCYKQPKVNENLASALK